MQESIDFVKLKIYSFFNDNDYNVFVLIQLDSCIRRNDKWLEPNTDQFLHTRELLNKVSYK